MMRLRNTTLLALAIACLVACSDDASETPGSSQLGFSTHELVVGQTVEILTNATMADGDGYRSRSKAFSTMTSVT